MNGAKSCFDASCENDPRRPLRSHIHGTTKVQRYRVTGRFVSVYAFVVEICFPLPLSLPPVLSVWKTMAKEYESGQHWPKTASPAITELRASKIEAKQISNDYLHCGTSAHIKSSTNGPTNFERLSSCHLHERLLKY